MRIHNRDIENTSGQAIQFNIWTTWAIDRTSARPQVNLSFFLSDSLNSSPLCAGFIAGARELYAAGNYAQAVRYSFTWKKYCGGKYCGGNYRNYSPYRPDKVHEIREMSTLKKCANCFVCAAYLSHHMYVFNPVLCREVEEALPHLDHPRLLSEVNR